MPAISLRDKMNSEVKPYSVIGYYAKRSDGRWVYHVGLAIKSSNDDRSSGGMQVAHLVFSGNSIIRVHWVLYHKQADVVGWLDDLDPQEAYLIDTYLNTIDKKPMNGRLPKYRINPPYVDIENHRTFCFEGSCVGLVMQAYREADIELLSQDYRNYPEVDRDLLEIIFHEDFLEYLNSHWEDLGLSPNNPCPMVLPGYVFHSMTPEDHVIRGESYHPTEVGYAAFPLAEGENG